MESLSLQWQLGNLQIVLTHFVESLNLVGVKLANLLQHLLLLVYSQQCHTSKQLACIGASFTITDTSTTGNKVLWVDTTQIITVSLFPSERISHSCINVKMLCHVFLNHLITIFIGNIGNFHFVELALLRRSCVGIKRLQLSLKHHQQSLLGRNQGNHILVCTSSHLTGSVDTSTHLNLIVYVELLLRHNHHTLLLVLILARSMKGNTGCCTLVEDKRINLTIVKVAREFLLVCISTLHLGNSSVVVINELGLSACQLTNLIASLLQLVLDNINRGE